MTLRSPAGAPLVLFVCRHGAATSVLAAEVDRLAKAAGVAIEAMGPHGAALVRTLTGDR